MPTKEQTNSTELRAEGPSINLVDQSGHQVFYTGRKQLNKIRKEEICKIKITEKGHH